MKYRFYTCDVFTETRFGGNQLAVLPKADGLTDQQMQQITREFNFSETTFVFPAQNGNTRKVRIFTPTREIPFAGHPNVGTAFVLATTGELGEIRSAMSVTFEEKAGVVPVTISVEGGRIASCELSAPKPLSLEAVIPPQLVASAISVSPEDVLTTAHQPQVTSVGLPFLIVELKDRSALQRARINASGFDAMSGLDTYMYTRGTDGFDLHARMFGPASGVPEDPATGSASCAVAGLLTHLRAEQDGRFSYRISQGVEMGRPSVLLARAEKVGGEVRSTGVGGASVLVSEGSIEV